MLVLFGRRRKVWCCLCTRFEEFTVLVVLVAVAVVEVAALGGCALG